MKSWRRALLVLLGLAAPAGAADDGLLVTAGEVTESRAVLWLRGTAPGPVRVEWGEAAGAPRHRAEVRVGPEADLTAKLPLEPLAPATRYRYRVSQGARAVAGEFVTAPPADAAASVRFAWSGDLGGRGGCRPIGGYPIFRALLSRPADFFLFVGDTIYADHSCGGPDRVPGYAFVARTLPEYRTKHRYNRADPAVQDYFRATSVYAIWDDHEVRNDFAGPAEPLMPIGRQAFLEYFPIVPPTSEPARLYRSFRWGKLLEVFILDTRQYRSPHGEPDGPAKTMLGAAQRSWLLESVTASSATWKVLVSSVTMSVPTARPRRYDGWSSAGFFGGAVAGAGGFATERDALLRTLRERGVRDLVVVTGDVHHAEVIRLEPAPGWPVWELIAGPLSAILGQPRPLDETLRPRSLYAMGAFENFGEISVEPHALTVRIVDALGAERFAHVIPASRR